ncbi:uncharacterized protein LOC129238609 [Anastrepha obliqua]|uniref:uncharacterized protein LOC129238609 n=1 Tax=Anastrepha obliqua TaxID=95512 RepID=UPI002408FD66|nr:uncharacterized protein LOC129238609 [Anastrepha obliqua]
MKVKIEAAKAKIPAILSSSIARQQVDVASGDNALALKLERHADEKSTPTETRHFHVVADDNENEVPDLMNTFDILPALSTLTSTTPTTTTATRNNLIYQGSTVIPVFVACGSSFTDKTVL